MWPLAAAVALAVALLVGLGIPALQRAQEVARRVESASNIHRLLNATRTYCADHNLALPDDLTQIEPYLGTPLTTCLENPHTGENPGYLYVKPGTILTDVVNPSSTPMIWEVRNGAKAIPGNVAYVDGHVEWREVAPSPPPAP